MAIAKKIGILLGSLAVALASWISSLPAWEVAFTTDYFGQGLGIIGAVVLAWLGHSPRKPPMP